MTQASESVRRALGQKESALADTDAALERVREANETLKSSEEHLRLVFDAAVDGIVELDVNDIVVRTNEAFCQMVHLDRANVEGQRWQALAASLEGADAGSRSSRRPDRHSSSARTAHRSIWSHASPRSRPTLLAGSC